MNESKTLIVIPARKGSSFTNKNRYPLNNLPLIHYTFEAADDACIPNSEIIVSTDCHYIKAEAQTWGFAIDDRPENLADSKSTLNDVAVYIAEKYPDYDTIIILPPTSPLRNSRHLGEAYDDFRSKNADSMVSVTEERRTIWNLAGLLWANPIREITINRQQVAPLYISNGAIFIAKREVILKHKKKFGGRVSLYVMSAEESVDVHNLEDIKLAEFYLTQRN